jgi:Tfp pilus assembly protein PilF
MIQFDGAPGSQQIESGNYDLAVQIARRMPGSNGARRFEALTQVCVASLKAGDLAAAAAGCDRAVTAARSRDTSDVFTVFADPSARKMRLVVAYTNPGVVHAITGDEAAAVRDFEAALTLRADQPQPLANLAYLERRGDYVAKAKE